MKKKTARKLESFLHFVTALLLIIKGVDQLIKGLYYPATIIMGLAVIILVIVLFWKSLKMKPKKARIACWYVASPAFVVMAYILYLEKKEFLPHFFILLAMMYPVMGFISSKKFKKMKKASQQPSSNFK
ncbi:MAG: hypothetical protein BM557_04400 [Flavobacterium sp. MedPE-SWcel]|uniref:hypothetical protein n=1 Tax=uncultured Flavobacterium sp. TaxID=165435 RepID=UPI00090F3477|nr:hypothetical protein [uncultured Flavobacterium sp.]OIQ21008.1 MAG: hypothetical protein BM557_04400 [Flavobacterium sp. MedPE-SWcel]